MKAKIHHVYLAKYIRNSESIWLGENTECLIHQELVKQEIHTLKSIWMFVGNGWNNFKHKNFDANNAKIFSPNAKDIIPLALLQIKNKKLINHTEHSINYLNNPF